jgi:hypothetical protein
VHEVCGSSVRSQSEPGNDVYEIGVVQVVDELDVDESRLLLSNN